MISASLLLPVITVGPYAAPPLLFSRVTPLFITGNARATPLARLHLRHKPRLWTFQRLLIACCWPASSSTLRSSPQNSDRCVNSNQPHDTTECTLLRNTRAMAWARPHVVITWPTSQACGHRQPSEQCDACWDFERNSRVACSGSSPPWPSKRCMRIEEWMRVVHVAGYVRV